MHEVATLLLCAFVFVPRTQSTPGSVINFTAHFHFLPHTQKCISSSQRPVGWCSLEKEKAGTVQKPLGRNELCGLTTDSNQCALKAEGDVHILRWSFWSFRKLFGPKKKVLLNVSGCFDLFSALYFISERFVIQLVDLIIRSLCRKWGIALFITKVNLMLTKKVFASRTKNWYSKSSFV